MATNKEKIDKITRDSWQKYVLGELKRIHGDPLPSIIEKGFIDIAENKNVPQKQIANWVGNLSAIGEKIEAGKGTGSDYSVFWIRLHEMLDYLPEYFENFNDLKLYLEISRLLREIKNSYSEVELIMIEYQRHCHSHIHQEGYRFKASYNKKGELLDKIGHDYKGKDKVELNDLINAEIKKYGIDEEKMALAYFLKNKEKFDTLWREIKREFKL